MLNLLKHILIHCAAANCWDGRPCSFKTVETFEFAVQLSLLSRIILFAVQLSLLSRIVLFAVQLSLLSRIVLFAVQLSLLSRIVLFRCEGTVVWAITVHLCRKRAGFRNAAFKKIRRWTKLKKIVSGSL